MMKPCLDEVRHWAGIWLAGLSWLLILLPLAIIALLGILQ